MFLQSGKKVFCEFISKNDTFNVYGIKWLVLYPTYGSADGKCLIPIAGENKGRIMFLEHIQCEIFVKICILFSERYVLKI